MPTILRIPCLAIAAIVSGRANTRRPVFAYRGAMRAAPQSGAGWQGLVVVSLGLPSGA